jgi:hypothetical protein
MRFPLAPNDFPRSAAGSRRALRWSIRLGAALFLFAQAGCTKEVRPGVTYNVTVIAQGNEGNATPQGSATRVESAAVGSEQVITHEGDTFSLVVRKTQYGKATFDVTFPDRSTERAQVKLGEPKDILPNGQKTGVRIEVQESH